MDRFSTLALAALAIGFFMFAAYLTREAPASVTELGTIRVAAGLEQPVYVTAPPGDTSRLFIVEANSGGAPDGPMEAHIKILNLSGPEAGTIHARPFLVIEGIPQVEDQGLFCLAFHPNYRDNGFFYVTYAIGGTGGESRVERYRVSTTDPNRADPGSATVILSFFKPRLNHSGNWLGFSPTDVANGHYYLYHTTGDGGSRLDGMNLAQDLSVKHGKILRIDVGADGLADDFPQDERANYAIPPDNPFVNIPDADPAIWALGLRNPWRASFDRQTGDLYIGNVGAHVAEEVEFQPFDSTGGENYGWSRLEGTVVGPNPGLATPTDRFPLYENRHGGNPAAGPGHSITGGYVYRGPVAALQGHYVFADFLGTFNFRTREGAAQVFSLQYDNVIPADFAGTKLLRRDVVNRTADLTPDVGTIDFIASFGEDAAGDLYIVDLGNLGTPDGLGLGEIYKICGQSETGANTCQ